MNAPDRYERFVVPEGTKMVSCERDTKIINAASFTVEREDHTIGNIIRMQLHKDENVLSGGYKLPPLQYKIIIRIHTTSQSSPMQAYNQAINDLHKELDHLKNAFECGCNLELYGFIRASELYWYTRLVISTGPQTYVSHAGAGAVRGN
ncbi:hypothetical protein GH714_017233 [Hevea brasiliensis]|uniref:DNA-directed RNA polymerase RBP11-like dimerisation domain-containing protein n=1 Tax=Hevea brasiliensis TaxID=3981 RepID=A0A6A6N068_HEVBR|nr:hypothetical protein GH714_017233 [Hevea brasiliensis]